MPAWFFIFSAAIHTLAAVAPSVIAQFGGGAHNTATKIGSALAVADQVTTQLGQGQTPSVDPSIVHPDLQAHAVNLQAAHEAAGTS